MGANGLGSARAVRSDSTRKTPLCDGGSPATADSDGSQEQTQDMKYKRFEYPAYLAERHCA